MPQTYKINFFFQHNEAGWSETYFGDYEDARAALSSAREAIPLRVALLGGAVGVPTPCLDKVRVSDIAISGDALAYQVPLEDGRNQTAISLADNANLSILVRAESGAIYRRQIYIAGFPDEICQDGKFVNAGNWQNLFNIFAASIRARGWGILAQDRTVATMLITHIRRVDPVIVELTFSAPHNMPVGTRFQVLAAPGTRDLRGIHLVYDVIDVTKVQIMNTFIGTPLGGGSARRVVMDLKVFTTLQIVGVASRRRGRPIDSPVGRRRRRR